ncbi:MAG: universal stress protein [Nodosilinea sp.]
MALFQRILVAVDREPTIARQVLAEAMAVAQGSGGTLNIIQVMPPLSSGYSNAMSSSLGGGMSAINTVAFEATLQQWQDLQQATQDRLNAQVAEVQNAGLAAAATFVIGPPAREICAAAEAWNADLIVIGRRGLKGLGQLLLGSVSSYVMHHSPCAVLIVQGDGLAAGAPSEIDPPH